jgi:hypothetical protein
MEEKMTKTPDTANSGELSLEELDQASGGFAVGKAIMDAYKANLAKDAKGTTTTTTVPQPYNPHPVGGDA